MKAKNLNNASIKTKKVLKATFAKMLSEKNEITSITVSELCKRADVSRGAFYSHYDDIFSVAEDYENELIDNFFDNVRLLNSHDFEKFIDTFFEYIRKNDENYKLLCRSNDFLFAAKKLTTIISNKFLEICLHDTRFTDKEHVDLDINIFIEGLTCEYVKYCRGYSATDIDDLYGFTKKWVADFIKRRSSQS